MKKLLQFVPFIVSIVAMAGEYLVYSCAYVTTTCYGSIFHQLLLPLFKPLYLYALWALIPTIIVIFVRPEVFKYWLKFAIGWALLAVIVLANIPVYPEGGGYMNLFTTTRSAEATHYGIAFAVISLILIAWKYWRINRKEQTLPAR